MAQAVLRGILYVVVWVLVTLGCGFFGLVLPVRGVSEPGAGAGFAMLLYGFYGLCLGASIGLIAVGGLSKALSVRRRKREIVRRSQSTCASAPPTFHCSGR